MKTIQTRKKTIETFKIAQPLPAWPIEPTRKSENAAAPCALGLQKFVTATCIAQPLNVMIETMNSIG